MQSENLIKCAHESCRCLVEIEDQFCSAVCGDSKQTPRDPCPCGHPECVGTEEAAESDELEESTEVSRHAYRPERCSTGSRVLTRKYSYSINDSPAHDSLAEVFARALPIDPDQCYFCHQSNPWQHNGSAAGSRSDRLSQPGGPPFFASHAAGALD